MKKHALIGVMTIVIALPTLAAGEKTEPDNTAVNAADKGVTAEHQGQAKTDLEITKQIRSGLTGNDSLSTYAKNIKVISQHGVVTLKGPVHSETERAEAERVAKSVAGVSAVKNQLTIAR